MNLAQTILAKKAQNGHFQYFGYEKEFLQCEQFSVFVFEFVRCAKNALSEKENDSGSSRQHACQLEAHLSA